MRGLLHVVILAVAALATTGARAADGAVIPAFAPVVGSSAAYVARVQQAFTVAGPFSTEGRTLYGEFRRRLTVESRSGDGFIIRWRAGADLPADASSAPDGVYDLNYEHWRRASFWNAQELLIETGPSGEPVRALNWPELKAQAEQTARRHAEAGHAANAAAIDEAIAVFGANPLQLIAVLLPEVEPMARGLSKERRATTDGPWELQRLVRINGFDIRIRERWSVESVDAAKGVVTLAWRYDADPDDLLAANRASIEEQIAEAVANEGVLLGDRRSKLSTASLTASGRNMISLRDGASLGAESRQDMIIGKYRNVVSVRMERRAD